MDIRTLLILLAYVLGTALILLAIADVFMTVLYARAGTGVLSHRLAKGGWAVVRRVARRLPTRRKDALLSFYGPAYLIALLTSWIALLLVGFTLIAWPGLGSGIQNQEGSTPTDLFTAFYYAGGSLTTVGSGDLGPVSPLYKFLTVIDSIIGISIVTLVMTYFIQIYNALQRRNGLAISLHHASGGTGDSAALLGGLGPGDDFSRGNNTLTGLAAEVTGVYESHHFYSVLIYFRFREPYYAMARGALICMELVTLIETALDENRHAWLKRSAAVTQIREGAMHVLTEFAGVYLPGGPPSTGEENDAQTGRWKQRYQAAIGHLKQAGISVTDDEAAGAEQYVAIRREWDARVLAFAHYMEHAAGEIDPTTSDPTETARHREMPTPPLLK